MRFVKFTTTIHTWQELETFMRGHDDKNKKKVEELAQSMLNNHIMVSTVTSELQEFKNRNRSLNTKVIFLFLLQSSNIRLISYYCCLQTQSFYVTSFFMFANTHLHVTSQCHVDINCNSVRFTLGKLSILKTGLVDHIGVLQTPMNHRVWYFVVYLNPWFQPQAIEINIFLNGNSC